MNKKDNASIPGGNQNIEANNNFSTVTTLYNKNDDDSTDFDSYDSDWYVDLDPDSDPDLDSNLDQTDALLVGDPNWLKEAILKAKTAHEAESKIIDYEIDDFLGSHDHGFKVSFEGFNQFVEKIFNHCIEAVEYRNDSSSYKPWKKPENLTRTQIERISDAIPVKSSNNFPKIIADITAEKIAEFKADHPDITTLVSTDYNKNSKKNSLIDALVEDILETIADEIDNHNLIAHSHQKWTGLKMLTNTQIVDIIKAFYPVISVITQENTIVTDESLMLCIYINDPDDTYYGIYSSSVDIFRSIIKCFNHSATKDDIVEIIMQLKSSAPRHKRENDRNLIPVGNGIFDYKTKMLNPFNPEYIFLSKTPVKYVENPENPILRFLPDGTDTGENWDVESWMHTLSDDPEIVELLWKIIGAIIRPNNRWNTSAWLYSESGNSGKGTLCELMRQICGDAAYASIPLSDFGKDFILEQLIGVSAIIVDENDVGMFIDKAGNLKAIITNDVIMINRKYKEPICYQFRGFTVQCLNEFPRFKDKSESFYRRQLFIPMNKCFTGKEKKYIKEDYLHNPKVLEYVLNKVLNMNYYTLEAPDACRNLLEEYKTFNDPVRDFFDKFKTEFVWDKLPFDFLYDLYGAWMRKDNPNGSIISKKQFVKEIRIIASSDNCWTLPDNKLGNFRVDNDMKSKGEPLSFEYDLRNWLNPYYGGPDIEKRSIPVFKTDPYYGIVRRGVNKALDEADMHIREE